MHCAKTSSQGANGENSNLCYAHQAVSWHCMVSIWRERAFNFCKKALVGWPNESLPRPRRGGTFSNSHKATSSACVTLPRTISWDPGSSDCYSTAQGLPCGSADTNNRASSWAGHPPELASLAWPEKLFYSPPLFLGKNSRRTSEKETGLLKS